MDIIKEMQARLNSEEVKYMFSLLKMLDLKYRRPLELIFNQVNVVSLEDFLSEVEYYSITIFSAEISDSLEYEAFRLCKLALKFRKYRRML